MVMISIIYDTVAETMWIIKSRRLYLLNCFGMRRAPLIIAIDINTNANIASM
ncbi:MAG: hypothetical protein J7L12_04620 [Desulfurococcales archaeon]|nr:hypothetical protein [Desulfurococcales archaeon]